MGKHGLGGIRPDLGFYVRSRWEANWARYLTWLQEQGQILRWEYEPCEFEFVSIKRGNRFYKPDFRITNLDGSIEYHEIKGFMDATSATKLKRMGKYFPEVVVILVDKEAYRAVAREMKRLPHWE